MNSVTCDNVQEMIDALTSIPKLSKGQAEYLETLSVLMEAHEASEAFVDVSKVTPIDVLKDLMKEHGMTSSDLGRLLGERSLGPKVLNGSRELSKNHIRALAQHFGVSPALFF